MIQDNGYLTAPFDNAVSAILKGIDRDVERGEDVLMLGLGLVMLSSTFAPIAPPTVLLPLVAFIFAASAGYARKNYHRMEQKLSASMVVLETHEIDKLGAIATVFAQYPMPGLVESFNPCKNLKRAGKSALGGLLINPLWMPIFYVMGMQIQEEANLGILNKAIVEAEQREFDCNLL
ncbi:hypothetical protein [Methylobacter psychrophilus]|uniref:hypothetical protein n=1 Tax=Methylobacter psychrophilus TaxID=96941 RepID=UPI0021D492E9|nr:hypothetical protein [Methylobacter psychrophilus]